MIRACFRSRVSDRARAFVLALAFVIGLVLLGPIRSIAGDLAGDIGVGERVVLIRGVLRMDGREVERSHRECHFYRVEAVNGQSLKLKAEDDCIAGVIASSEAVSVSQGIDFFTKQIELNPTYGFAYLMRLAPLVG